MGPIRFHIELFGKRGDKNRSRKVLLLLMECLSQINILWLKKNKAPPLYKSGVRYEREPQGIENWQDIPHILANGVGDCEDLACWRIAELRLHGIKARPYIKWRRDNGLTTYHALVMWPNQKIEDPSLALGMGGKMINRPVFVRP